jgi:uncharacterized BrkB/YihY/UPF0761 family membrane protein
MSFRPLTLVAISIGAFGALLVAVAAEGPHDCSPHAIPRWYTWVAWIIGLTCLAAPLAAAYAFGTERGRSWIAGFGGFVLATGWIAIEVIVAFALSGCPPSA